MATIGELAKLVRSKNAGPFVMTIDIMFADQKTYDTVKSSGILNRQMVSNIYNMSENQVQFFEGIIATHLKSRSHGPIFRVI